MEQLKDLIGKMQGYIAIELLHEREEEIVKRLMVESDSTRLFDDM